MRILKAAFAVLMLLVCAAIFVKPARADTWDKKTIVTFHRTVEMPGLVLPAGTYTFEVDRSMRNVVRVYNRDKSMVLGTILTVGDYRLKPAEQTVLEFREQPVGVRPAVHAWFYPAEIGGREFVYPK